jgi:hypothetical protein
MNNRKTALIILFALITILFITNPSEDKHIQEVKTKLKSAFKKEMSKNLMNETSSDKSFGSGLGLLFGDIFIDKLTDGFVSRDNFFLFSLTKAEYKGETKTIGFGVLGNVFVTDKIRDIFNQNKETENTEKTESQNDYQSEKEIINNEVETEKSKVRTISGIIKTELHYGAPNFGEDTINDKKVYPYILFLDKQISVFAEDGFESTYNHIEKIQLTSTHNIKFEALKGRKVVLTGELFESDNGNHFTDILLDIMEVKTE